MRGLKYAVFFLCALFIVLLFPKHHGDREALRMLDAVRRASSECFSLEGRYAPSLDYLEREYGPLPKVPQGFRVVYRADAPNLAPEIFLTGGRS